MHIGYLSSSVFASRQCSIFSHWMLHIEHSNVPVRRTVFLDVWQSSLWMTRPWSTTKYCLGNISTVQKKNYYTCRTIWGWHFSLTLVFSLSFLVANTYACSELSLHIIHWFMQYIIQNHALLNHIQYFYKEKKSHEDTQQTIHCNQFQMNPCWK